MIVIFSNENDLSTIDVAKRLKQMKQDVIIIEPDTAENMLIGIDNEVTTQHPYRKLLVNKA